MSRPVLVVLSLCALACSDVTAPSSDPATIVFRVEPGCAPSLAYALFIDAERVGERTMAPLDSVAFAVPPGDHTASALVVDGLFAYVWLTPSTTLVSGQRQIVHLRC